MEIRGALSLKGQDLEIVGEANALEGQGPDSAYQVGMTRLLTTISPFGNSAQTREINAFLVEGAPSESASGVNQVAKSHLVVGAFSKEESSPLRCSNDEGLGDICDKHGAGYMSPRDYYAALNRLKEGLIREDLCSSDRSELESMLQTPWSELGMLNELQIQGLDLLTTSQKKIEDTSRPAADPKKYTNFFEAVRKWDQLLILPLNKDKYIERFGDYQRYLIRYYQHVFEDVCIYKAKDGKNSPFTEVISHELSMCKNKALLTFLVGCYIEKILEKLVVDLQNKEGGPEKKTESAREALICLQYIHEMVFSKLEGAKTNELSKLDRIKVASYLEKMQNIQKALKSCCEKIQRISMNQTSIKLQQEVRKIEKFVKIYMPFLEGRSLINALRENKLNTPFFEAVFDGKSYC